MAKTIQTTLLLEGNFPEPTREIRIVPMPKRMCTSLGRVLTLGTSGTSGVLTELEAATFALRKQTRSVPVMHKLFVNSNFDALAYTQPHGKGHPSELHFLDPALNLVRAGWAADACTGFASCGPEWVVACRDGTLISLDRSGNLLWTWQAPPARHPRYTSLFTLHSPSFLLAASDQEIFAAEGLYLYALSPRGELLWEWELPNRHETGSVSIPLGRDRFQALALKTLGLPHQATPEEIRSAHRRMVRLTHPDLHPDDENAAERFRSIQQAYDCLQGEPPGPTCLPLRSVWDWEVPHSPALRISRSTDRLWGLAPVRARYIFATAATFEPTTLSSGDNACTRCCFATVAWTPRSALHGSIDSVVARLPPPSRSTNIMSASQPMVTTFWYGDGRPCGYSTVMPD